MSKKVDKIIDIVLSSKRAMPAHFTSVRDRQQTFLVDYDIPKKDEAIMANEVYNLLELNADAVDNPYFQPLLIKIGEDVMLCGYISKVMNLKIDQMTLRQRMVDENIAMCKDIDEFDGVEDFLKRSDVEIYLEKCSYYGHSKMHLKLKSR